MHDTMAAIQGPRISPIQYRDLQPSVIKKAYEPLAKVIEDDFDESYDEMDDEDDFSDHDSHYSEDLLDDEMQVDCERQPDVTQQLLNFAEMVNADIKKYFGRRKGDEDSCDIYEDKWVAPKSGRELYYADLLRIAQGGDGAVDHRSSKTKRELTPVLESLAEEDKSVDNRSQFTGRMDKALGLGPLNELFDYGLRQYLADRKHKHKQSKRLKVDIRPMQDRTLPGSFWREPGTVGQRTNSLIQPPRPPDFSDLLSSWEIGLHGGDFNGDLSSSEMSVASNESIDHV
jgi:hypothetical protein